MNKVDELMKQLGSQLKPVHAIDNEDCKETTPPPTKQKAVKQCMPLNASESMTTSALNVRDSTDSNGVIHALEREIGAVDVEIRNETQELELEFERISRFYQLAMTRHLEFRKREVAQVLTPACRSQNALDRVRQLLHGLLKEGDDERASQDDDQDDQHDDDAGDHDNPI